MHPHKLASKLFTFTFTFTNPMQPARHRDCHNCELIVNLYIPKSETEKPRRGLTNLHTPKIPCNLLAWTALAQAQPHSITHPATNNVP